MGIKIYCSAQCPIISVNANPYRGYCVPAHSARTTRALPTCSCSAPIIKTSTMESIVKTTAQAQRNPPLPDIFRRAWQAKILTTCVLPTQLQWHSQPNAHFLAALQPATVQRLRQRIAQRVKIHRLFKIRRRSQIAAEILRFCPTLATDHKHRNQLRGAE